MPHPHGDTCRCPPPQPDDGLLAYTVDCDHYRDLRETLDRVAVLRVTTFPATPPANLVALPDPTACDQSMTCQCTTCSRERARRVRQGARDVRQPWMPVRRAA